MLPLLASVVLLLRALGAPDHYQELGVQPSASLEEIRRKYKAAALANHPDRCVRAPAEERESRLAKFKRVSAAYETLSNPRTRAEYDARRSLHSAHGFRPPPPADTPFTHLPTQTVVVRCTLRELFNGAPKFVRVPGLVELNVILRPEWQHGHSFSLLSDSGQHVRVVIAVRPHHDLARRGDDLVAERMVTRRGAARGKPLRVRAIDGRILTFRPLRGGAWRDGQRLAWRGAGMWTVDGSTRGDLVLTVRVADWLTVLGMRTLRAVSSRAFIRTVQIGILAMKIDGAVSIVRAWWRALHSVLSAVGAGAAAAPINRRAQRRARARRSKTRG